MPVPSAAVEPCRPFEARPSLRPYQLRAVDDARRLIQTGKRRLVVVAPTGAGKSVIAAHIAALAAARGNRLLFLAHRLELVEQLSQKLDAVGIHHGVIQGGHWRRMPNLPVQVASVPTLCRREALPPADVLVVDEAHHVPSASFRKIVEAYPKAIVLGFTATPYRLDGRGLGDHFEDLVVVAQVPELIADGYLVPPIVFAPSEPDVSMVKRTGGDFNRRELAFACDKPTLVGDVVDTWRVRAAGRSTVVFAVSIDHSRHLVEQFRAAGVTAEHLDADTPAQDRAAILARAASGATTVLSNCSILTEGWDLPRLSCVVKARPTDSRSLDRQMTGRGLRPSPGKVDCLILDHAGNVYRHGLPTEPEEFRLEGIARRAPGETVPSVRTCPLCLAVTAGGTPICPGCAEPFPERKRSILVKKGELAAVSDWAQTASPDRRVELYAKWERVAREKKYRPGYAASVFRAAFGAWPDESIKARAAEVNG